MSGDFKRGEIVKVLDGEVLPPLPGLVVIRHSGLVANDYTAEEYRAMIAKAVAEGRATW